MDIIDLEGHNLLVWVKFQQDRPIQKNLIIFSLFYLI